MSWIQKLYETYENCNGKEPPGSEALMPIAHTTQQAQIEVVLDDNGLFRRASVLPKGNQTTLIPCTDDSGVRSGRKPPHHPLCDKLQYVAGDFLVFGGQVTSGFSKDPEEPHREYLKALEKWIAIDGLNLKIKAIYSYVKKGSLVKDLIDQKILFTEKSSSMLLKEWPGTKESMPEIFRAVSNEQAPEDSFIRWRVEGLGSLVSGTWEDKDLMKSWISYSASLQTSRGVCLVTGMPSLLPDKHPNKIRHAGDKAKLISSNDKTGFTFRGRFTDDVQAASISFDVTQKAHNALRWLIARKQSSRNGDQVFISWALGGQAIPDPWINSKALFDDIDPSPGVPEISQIVNIGDIGQAFSLRLNKAIAGYKANLGDNVDIVVMGLDSATPGRMAIIFYRELKGSEFLDGIEKWHADFAWRIRFAVDDSTAKKKKRVEWIPSAPSPKSIAEACYGKRLDAKLLKSTLERLLPCIVDGRGIPRDIVDSAGHRATNRLGLENWEWEQTLGIACALYKGFHKERQFQMALEKDRKTRDYLYGRLLAIGERVEDTALYIAKENRDTGAAKLMQRFSDRPFSTWKTIETSLPSYFSRIKARWPGVQSELRGCLDEVVALFEHKDFVNDSRLSGEFLLGFHCQRQFFKDEFQKRKNESQDTEKEKGEE